MKRRKKYYNKNESLKELKYLLVTLITTIAITGVSFVDNAIWAIIMAIIGTITYGIVGGMYSLRLIHGKKAGSDAYVAVFIILILIGIFVFNGIIKVINWILSWPLLVKILVPVIIFLGIIVTVVLIIIKTRHNNIVASNDSDNNFLE